MVDGFDYTQFMMVGCCKMNIDPAIVDPIYDVIINEKWAISENAAPSILLAHWMKRSANETPDEYRQLLEYIDRETTEIFGPEFVREHTTLWIGGETIDWHHHTRDEHAAEDFLWLIYLGSKVWPPDAGGLIMAKSSTNDVELTFEPSFGTALLLNNSNEHFLHKTTKFNPICRRVAMQLGYVNKNKIRV